MTLQDRMAMFEKPGLPMNTPAKVAKKNKFNDRLAAFEGAKTETSPQQSPQKNNNTQKPAATFAQNSNNHQEKKDSDKPTVYHYEVKANTDNVKPEVKKSSSQVNSPSNQTKSTKPVITNATTTASNTKASIVPTNATNSLKSNSNTHASNVSNNSSQPSTPGATTGQTKCTACQKTVYVVEQIMIDDKSFHKACLKCSHCNMVLKLGNYASLEGSYFVRFLLIILFIIFILSLFDNI